MPFDVHYNADLSTAPLSRAERRKVRGIIRAVDRRNWLIAQAMGWFNRLVTIPAALVAVWKVLEVLKLV